MKAPLPATPEQWLKENEPDPRKRKEIIDSFESPDKIKAYKYMAPALFFRFHATHEKSNIARCNYWADAATFAKAWERASQFEGWLKDREISQIAKSHYRDATAICHNWNELASNTLWKLELRGAESVEGLEGPVKGQPTHAADSRKGMPASVSRLAGGGTQVVLHPKSPFICTPIHW